MLERWLRRTSPTADLHLVGADGEVVLALLADGRSRLGAAFGSVAEALDSSWEFLGGGPTLKAATLLSDAHERPLSLMLWDLAQLAATDRWIGDLGPNTSVVLRFWPFQAAESSPAASQAPRRLRKGAAPVSELLALASNGREDVVRVLHACLAIEAISVVARATPGTPEPTVEPVPVVEFGGSPTRIGRMLASIRRALSID